MSLATPCTCSNIWTTCWGSDVSRLTQEEWIAAYVLQFGAVQVWDSNWTSGEEEFCREAAKDLGMLNEQKTAGAPGLFARAVRERFPEYEEPEDPS